MKIEFPEISKKRWKALIAAAAIVTFVRIMLQPFIPAGEGQVETSVIVDAGLLIPSFVIYAFVAYLIIGYAFVMLDARLPWSKNNKGMFFAMMLALIWVLYLFEPVPLGSGASLIDSLAYPIVDGISVLILGVLLGRFVACEPFVTSQKIERKYSALLAIPISMLIVRLFEYNVLDIYSSYADRTLDTLLWVIITGLGIGLAYVVLRTGVPSSAPGGRSVAFGLFFYGIPIVFVNFFVILALKIDVADMALRSTMDILAVIAAIYSIEIKK